jgi:predicted dehydrogenase
MSQDKVTVGIVGTGVGIRTHLAGLVSIEDVEVVGVVGSSVERSREHLADAGFDNRLACSSEELFRSHPDVLCLTTPPNARYEYRRMLQSFSGTLLVEKPVATTFNKAEEFASDLHSIKHAYVDFQLRGLPAMRWIRDVVRNGELGELYCISLMERTSAFRQERVADWQEHRGTGGGQAYAMGTHLIDLGVFLSGQTYGDATGGRGAITTPRGSWIDGPSPHSDLADEVFDGSFEVNACEIRMFTSSISAGTRTIEFCIEGTEGTLEFRFRDGAGHLDMVSSEGHRIYALGRDGSLIEGGRTESGLGSSLFRVAYPAYAQALVDSVRGVGEKDNCLATLQDGIDNMRILDAGVRHD